MQRRVIGFHDESENHGGTTRYLHALLAGLDRDRYQPVFFASRRRAWHRDVEALGARVFTLDDPTPGLVTSASTCPTEKTTRPGRPTVLGVFVRKVPRVAWAFGQLRELRTLTRLFALHAVDLLHTNQAGLETASIAARLCRVPLVVGTWHVDPSYDLEGTRRGLQYRLVEALSIRAFHHSVSVSDDTRRQWMTRCWLGRSHLHQVTVIHNGIETEPFRDHKSMQAARERLQLPDGELVLGSLGRLEPAKGYTYLLAALAELREEAVPVTLLLAGRGPEEAALRRRAQELGIEQQVRFLGFLSDVRQLLASVDIYVQPSLCESLGLGILEAGAAGIPVVASRVGGIPETVLDGETGMLVSPRDPQALAAALKHMMSEENLRRAMGLRAQERVCEHFTSEAMVRKTVTLYDSLLAGPR